MKEQGNGRKQRKKTYIYHLSVYVFLSSIHNLSLIHNPHIQLSVTRNKMQPRAPKVARRKRERDDEKDEERRDEKQKKERRGGKTKKKKERDGQKKRQAKRKRKKEGKKRR